MEHIEIKPIKYKQIQMTQVAADENVQGRGVGRSMVKYSEDFATRFGFQEMVIHARENAVPFYEMLSYSKIGDYFTEVTIPHRGMVKAL